MSKFNLKKVFEGFKNTFLQHPIEIIICFLIFGISNYMIDYKGHDGEKLVKVIRVLLAGFFIFLNITLFSKHKKLNKKLLIPLGIILTAVYFFILKEEPKPFEVVQELIFYAVLGLMTPLIDYLKKDDKIVNKYIYYVEKLLLASIFGSIFHAGLSAAIGVTDLLFSIKFSYTIYGRLALLIYVLFVPIYFLKGINDEAYGDIKTNPVSKALIEFVLVPLAYIYLVIQYAYFGKILISRTMPQGVISYLVIAYSICGLLILFVSSIIDNIRMHVKLYKKYFFYSLIIPIGMLFTSIYIRINQYGLTAKRYIIFALGIYLVLIIAYYILSKKKLMIIIPISIILFAVITILSPINANTVSINSQFKQAKELLIEYKVLVNGKIVKKDLTEKEKNKLRGPLNYLFSYEALDEAKEISNDFKKVRTKGEYFDLLGFSPYKAYNGQNHGDVEYINVNFSNANGYVVPVKNYNKLFNINYSEYRKAQYIIKSGNDKLIVDMDSIRLINSSIIREKIMMNDIMNQIYKNNIKNKQYYTYVEKIEDLTIVKDNYMIIVKSLSYSINTKNKELKLKSINADIYFK